MWKTFLKDYSHSLYKWWWGMVSGPIYLGINEYQQITGTGVDIPIWGRVLIGVSGVMICQFLAYRSLWLKVRINAQDNWITKHEMEYGELPSLPHCLSGFVGKYTSGPLSKEIELITPSKQSLNRLGPKYRKMWEDLVKWKGEDPKYYI